MEEPTEGSAGRPRLDQTMVLVGVATLTAIVVTLVVHLLFLVEGQRLQERQVAFVQAQEQVYALRHATAKVEESFLAYVLTGHSSRLTRMVDSESKLALDLTRLNTLVVEDAELTAWIQVLGSRLREWLESRRNVILKLDGAVRDSPPGGTVMAEVLEYVGAGEGLAASQTLDKLFLEVEARLEKDLASVTLTQAQIMHRAVWALALAVLSSSLAAVLIWMTLLRRSPSRS